MKNSQTIYQYTRRFNKTTCMTKRYLKMKQDVLDLILSKKVKKVEFWNGFDYIKLDDGFYDVDVIMETRVREVDYYPSDERLVITFFG
jgi:hypothetical protein